MKQLTKKLLVFTLAYFTFSLISCLDFSYYPSGALERQRARQKRELTLELDGFEVDSRPGPSFALPYYDDLVPGAVPTLVNDTSSFFGNGKLPFFMFGIGNRGAEHKPQETDTIQVQVQVKKKPRPTGRPVRTNKDKPGFFRKLIKVKKLIKVAETFPKRPKLTDFLNWLGHKTKSVAWYQQVQDQSHKGSGK